MTIFQEIRPNFDFKDTGPLCFSRLKKNCPNFVQNTLSFRKWRVDGYKVNDGVNERVVKKSGIISETYIWIKSSRLYEVQNTIIGI